MYYGRVFFPTLRGVFVLKITRTFFTLGSLRLSLVVLKPSKYSYYALLCASSSPSLDQYFLFFPSLCFSPFVSWETSLEVFRRFFASTHSDFTLCSLFLPYLSYINEFAPSRAFHFRDSVMIRGVVVHEVSYRKHSKEIDASFTLFQPFVLFPFADDHTPMAFESLWSCILPSGACVSSFLFFIFFF